MDGGEFVDAGVAIGSGSILARWLLLSLLLLILQHWYFAMFFLFSSHPHCLAPRNRPAVSRRRRRCRRLIFIIFYYSYLLYCLYF